MKRASETHLQEVYDTEPRGFDDGNEAPRVGADKQMTCYGV